MVLSPISIKGIFFLEGSLMFQKKTTTKITVSSHQQCCEEHPQIPKEQPYLDKNSCDWKDHDWKWYPLPTWRIIPASKWLVTPIYKPWNSASYEGNNPI